MAAEVALILLLVVDKAVKDAEAQLSQFNERLASVWDICASDGRY